jgi:hypothetical protein
MTSVDKDLWIKKNEDIYTASQVFHLIEAALITVNEMDFGVNESRSFRLDHIHTILTIAQAKIAPLAREDVDRRRDI